MTVQQRVDQALAWQQSGDYEKAAEAYRAVIRLQPGNRAAHNNLGQILLDRMEFAEAEASFRRAIRLRASDPGGHVNLGAALLRQDRYAEAITAFEAALRLDPHDPGARNNLAGLFKDLGRYDDAMLAYRHALETAPNASTHSNYLLALHYGQRLSRAELYAEHRTWAARYAPPPPTGGWRHRNSRDPERRLRLAYLSSDFRFHPVSYFMGAILANHDRDQFDVFCFSTSKGSDRMTGVLRNITPNWRDCGFLDDRRLADEIAREQIDVLIDLGGHTAGNRMGTMALKPAPVQMTYLGYPDTTGLDAVDCRITDAWADPPGSSEAFATERLVRVSSGFVAYRPPANAPDVTELPALASGAMTFGSFNNLAKLSDESLRLWSRVLAAVPGSRFLLKSKALDDSATRSLVIGRFAAQGIPASRLEIVAGSKSVVEVLAAYSRVDVALDPAPYNGTTTTCEALWMGVPVVTLAGDRHSGRVGVSLLNAAGLGGLVAPTPEAYVKIAASLANGPAELAALRRDLRARLTHSPLLDARRLTRELESAYRSAWRHWCRGAPADPSDRHAGEPG